ncbi:MAG: ABC transporter substrate-binding protein [Bacilli bacterium]
MKKIFLIGGGVIITILFVFTMVNLVVKKDNNNDLTKITVAEVTHSVFYAPWYVALENGYFEDEGLDIEVILTPGADKVTAAVLSNDVQIGFCGPEGTIYVYEGGEEDYLVTFAGLTKRDGQFIVGREKIDNFSVQDLIGKEVLVGRKGGMPSLNFINGVKNSNVDINNINLNYAVEFAALSGAFIGGTGDFVNLFELSVRRRSHQAKNLNVF